jgi:uncharacterized protein
MRLQRLGLLLIAVIVATAAMATSIVVVGKIVGPIPLAITATTTNKQSTFDAEGTAEVTVVPDIAQVNLGLTITRGTVAQAQDDVNQVMASLATELGKLGIAKEDIKTTNYSINPEYDFNSGARRTVGYMVNSSMYVRIKEFEKVNQVIDAATQVGITEVNGVSFTLSEEKEAEVKKQARQEAIDKAKENAQELSSLAGMRLGKVVNIYEIPNYGDEPVPYMDARMALGGAENVPAPTDLEPGTSKYTYSVTLSYETL